MGYAKYTEDDNEIRMERYQAFDSSRYYSDYYPLFSEQENLSTQEYTYQPAKYFNMVKEDEV